MGHASDQATLKFVADFLLIRSPELQTDVPLAWFETSGSGQTGVTGSFPIEKVRATEQPFYEALKRTGANEIEISSVSVAVYAHYRAKRFPDPKGPPPRLVVFPEFLRDFRALSARDRRPAQPQLRRGRERRYTNRNTDCSVIYSGSTYFSSGYF